MTRLFGVIGSPISHSLSPAMHTAALRALRLDALYAAFEVPPRCVKPILRALILAGVEGLNVTVPLKETVPPLMDRLDPTAKAVGAVNTVVIRNRRTIGYNTDGVGFRRALQELCPSRDIPARLHGRPISAVILGAGGAARAVAWELTRVAGSIVTIVNRHVARATRLARWLSQRRPRARVSAAPLARVSLAGVELLVNATTVGMQAADGLLVAPAALHPRLVVYDLVYHRETPLVLAARRRGCVAANGLSMLLYQGAESFRLWLRRSPPLEPMRQALLGAVASGALHAER
ncbi:MAG: shikimate dehydrogenase [Candidatus Omnitrophica bacterium]|nr:shikimate dehydrogenase [Candidatus Omnitrophota bacterium]MBI2496355.1 shikimate dehydrogenase [Candidatus Omnitrophota bacterium]MBI3020421.1 shikimate dehydrogenase [Candidatus Omnitrophota bacterium]